MIAKGYKQTEIGLIPNDWSVANLGDIGRFFKGKGIRKDEVVNDGIPCVRYGELYTLYNNVIKNTFSFITEEVSKESIKLRYGDVLFAGSGETREDIGKSAVVLRDDCYAGGDIVILRAKDVNSVFLGYLSNSDIVNYQKSLNGQGDTVVHIYAKGLESIKIPIPPTLKEQEAIAKVLTDTDNLIQGLENVIAKKKAIKKGAMQELLTPPNKGGKRLPSFSGEWVEKSLGEVCDVKKGQLITGSTRVKGNVPVIAGGKKPAYYHNTANRTGRTITISGSGANAGYVSFHQYDIFASDCSTISESTKYDIRFIYNYLKLIQDRIYKKQTGGAQPHIHPSDINPIIFHLPLDIEEQQAIATVLSDMDKEIDALEIKKEKYIQLKKGLAQELLTGETRLV